MEEKQRKCSVSSDDSDTTDSHATSWSRCSKIPTTKTTCARQKEKKPSEVFRTDLITAMKVPDSHQFGPDDFYILADPWRQDWEKGVQVPANIDAVPQPQVRLLEELEDYYSQTANNSSPDSECPGGTQQATCRYDLDEVDTCWLELVNKEFKKMDMPHLEELTLEKVLEELELLCHENMNLAIEKEEGLGIEYDEDVVCDVCRSPEGEDGNEMVFCDKCNVCVHQLRGMEWQISAEGQYQSSDWLIAPLAKHMTSCLGLDHIIITGEDEWFSIFLKNILACYKLHWTPMILFPEHFLLYFIDF